MTARSGPRRRPVARARGSRSTGFDTLSQRLRELTALVEERFREAVAAGVVPLHVIRTQATDATVEGLRAIADQEYDKAYRLLQLAADLARVLSRRER